MIIKLYKQALTIFGDLMLTWRPPRVKAMHIRKAMDVIQPGDLILRAYNYYLDSICIKAVGHNKYTHSAFCIDKDSCVEAVSEGVVVSDTIDFIKDADAFIIIRPDYRGDLIKRRAIQTAWDQVGKPYDFFFNKDNTNEFFCHELSRYCLNSAGIKVKTTYVKFLWIEKQTYTAQNLIDVCKVVYEVK